MIETLSPAQLAIAAAIMLIAYVVRGITGFGSGLIAIPLLTLMLPITLVVPLIGLLDYLASLSHGVHHRCEIRWRDLLPLLPFSLAGILIALYLFKTVDAELLSRVLGGFVLLYAIYSILSHPPKGGHSRLWAAPLGSLGALVGTLFGTGGPFYVIYLQLRGLDKTAFRASVATIFMLDGAGRIVGYTASGFYTMELLWMLLASLPLVAVAMYVGGHIHTNISAASFRRAIGVALIGSGLMLLLR